MPWRKPIHDLIVNTLIKSRLFNEIVHATKDQNMKNVLNNFGNLSKNQAQIQSNSVSFEKKRVEFIFYFYFVVFYSFYQRITIFQSIPKEIVINSCGHQTIALNRKSQIMVVKLIGMNFALRN